MSATISAIGVVPAAKDQETPPIAGVDRTRPPRVPRDAVALDRHRRHLARLVDRRICLIQAPAGYGKSTLLADWHGTLDAAGAAVGWLSCDGAVAFDLNRCLRTLIAATTRHGAADDGRKGWVFLDDIDRLRDSTTLDRIGDLLRHPPVDLCVVMTARGMPPIPLDDLDLNHAIVRIGAEALTIREDEAARLCPDEPRDWVSKRQRQLGGWPAGMRGGRRDDADVLAAMLAEAIPDPADRVLLARLAPIGTIGSGLLARLGQASADRLDALAVRGAFVTRRGSGYHTLPPLAAALPPPGDADLAAADRRAAAADCIARAETTSAIAHLVAAGERADAAALLRETAMAMLERGEIAALTELADRLPFDPLLAEPLAWGRLWRGEEDAAALPAVVVWRALSGNDPAGARHAGETLAKALPGLSGDLLRARLARAALDAGDCEAAHRQLRPLRAAPEISPLPAALAAIVTADCYRAQGCPGDAERVMRTAHAALVRSTPDGSVATGLVAAHLAFAFYERSNLDAAEAMVDSCGSAIAAAGSERATMRAQIVQSRIAAERGRMAQAASIVEAGEALAFRRGWLQLEALCVVERARLGLPRTVAACRLLPLDAEEDAIAAPGTPEARLFAILAEVHVYEAMDAGDRPRLNLVADRLARLARALGDEAMMLRATLFSILPQLSGRCDRMVDLTAVRTLNRGAGNGFRRTLIDVLTVNGVRVAADLGSAGFAPQSFLGLLAEVRAPAADVAVASHDHAPSEELSFLTAREIDILAALASGISNKEMARVLKLTPETVKWHLKNVMRKLGAENRGEAVSHAAALGLDLAPSGAAIV